MQSLINKFDEEVTAKQEIFDELTMYKAELEKEKFQLEVISNIVSLQITLCFYKCVKNVSLAF